MVRISAYHICRVKRQTPVKHSFQPSLLPSPPSYPTRLVVDLVWYTRHFSPYPRYTTNSCSDNAAAASWYRGIRRRNVQASIRRQKGVNIPSLSPTYLLITSGVASIPRLHRPGPARVKCPRSADRPADPASRIPTTVHSERKRAMAGVCHLAARPKCTRRNLSRGNGSTASLREREWFGHAAFQI